MRRRGGSSTIARLRGFGAVVRGFAAAVVRGFGAAVVRGFGAAVMRRFAPARVRAFATTIVVAVASCHHDIGPTFELTRTTELPVAKAVAVVEVGDTVFAFDGNTVTIARGGSVVTRVEAPAGKAFVAAAVIAAPDGNGRWVVADLGGALVRVTAEGELDPVGDRFGIAGDRVVDVSASASTFGIGLRDGVAASRDGVHVVELSGSAAVRVAVAKDRLARADAQAVHVIDLAHGTEADYPFAGATRLAYVGADSATPRLAIANDELVYVETRGKLARVAVPGPITGISAGADRLWIAAAGALYGVGDDGAVQRAAASIARDARLFGSSTGDVWVASASLRRYSPARAADPAWQANVAPVFTRVCAHCHLPGGSADVDLSTAAAWRAHRDELVQRVVVTRTMPPAGSELSDAERQALNAWLQPPR